MEVNLFDKVLTVKKYYTYYNDITFMNDSDFPEFLNIFNIKFINSIDNMYEWGNKDFIIFTENNPITGVFAEELCYMGKNYLGRVCILSNSLKKLKIILSEFNILIKN